MRDTRPFGRELIVIPLLTLALHLLTWRGYGWFRDELYYVACARHLAWGYVDQPPLSIAVLRCVIGFAGESLFAIRAVAGAAGALTVLCVGLITRELGGGRFARIAAMTATLAAPECLAIDFYYSMNAIDILIWSAATFALLRAVRRGDLVWWPATGVLLGLGLLNKVSVLWLGGGVSAALLMTSYRSSLRRPGPWIATAIAALLFAPHVIWQVHHGWPTLEFMKNAGGSKMSSRGVLSFTTAAVMDEGPLVALFGVVGLAAAFTRWIDPRGRLLAWIWIAVFVLLAVNGTSRTGYLAPAWCLAFALGGLWLEHRLAHRSASWRVTSVALLALFGVVSFPLAVPILPTDKFVAYAAALGQKPSTEEKKDVGRLPQFFADMNGWDSMVESIDAAWRRLPVDRQSHAVFFGTNYGESAAIDVIGRNHGLPAVGTHNNYFYWGPPPDDVDAVIVMSQNPSRWAGFFDHVELAGETDCGDCMPYENHRQIYIAWGRRVSWASVWPGLKHFE